MNAQAQRVLVLGGSYFIGLRCVEQLLADGHEVTVLNRGRRPVPGARQLVADREDAAQMERSLDGEHFDTVVDFSCYNDLHARTALIAAGGRFRHWVLISSATVYTDNDVLPVPESRGTGGNPAWGSYGANKSAAEQVFRAAPESDATTILRPPYVYGPGNNLDRETFVWARVLEDRPILVPGQGEAAAQFLHVQDLATAVAAAMRSQARVTGRTYNVAGADGTTLAGWVRLVAAAAGATAKLVHVPSGTLGKKPRDFFPFRDLCCFVDDHRFRAQADWQPAWGLAAGLAATFETYDSGELAGRELDTVVEDALLNQLGSEAT